MSEPKLWSASSVVERFVPGDGHDWATELAWLWSFHEEKMLELLRDVNVSGVREPVLLNPEDGRVWDGHHRIAVALALGRAVPVVFAGDQRG